MSLVFVVDTAKRPLNPIHPGYARRLLTRGEAAVWRRFPFAIILKRALSDVSVEPLRLKIDPGSTTTGLAIINEGIDEGIDDRITDGNGQVEKVGEVIGQVGRIGQVVAAAEITHRGQQVRTGLATRHAVRRSRRSRQTRYRPARADNRRRPDGWLAPSLESRVQNILTWVVRLRRMCPIGAISLELVKFDTQLMQHPDISGVAYQQGELAGYEVREYLLEKWQRTCAYCGATSVPLQIEHIVPKARGGSDRVSNLTLACEPCNKAKGTQTAAEFGHPEIQARAQYPLKGAAAVNTTRWVLMHRLGALGLPVETGTGGRTKWNRTQRGLPKHHWLDAACVGASTPAMLITAGIAPLHITAMGRESRQMCRMDRSGFPRTAAKGQRHVKGFQTGDLVRAVVPAGVKAGSYVGRVAVRATGSFNLSTAHGTVQGISYRFCQVIQRADGYAYTTKYT